jgi:WD40 repeat protein
VFTPDGKKLLSGGADGKTILWDFPQAIQPDRVFAYGCAWIKDYLENNTELTSAQKKLCQHSFHS